jgi:hypothetical protein
MLNGWHHHGLDLHDLIDGTGTRAGGVIDRVYYTSSDNRIAFLEDVYISDQDPFNSPPVLYNVLILNSYQLTNKSIFTSIGGSKMRRQHGPPLEHSAKYFRTREHH